MMNIGRHWFESLDHYTLFKEPVIDAINKHKQKGNSIALVSGSFQPCLAPILEHIGGRWLLCTDLETVSNVLTGNIKQQAIGAGKRTIIERFASEQKLHLANCYAYGDDISDLDMMASVGHPVAVASGDGALVAIARSRDWPVI
ncbi:HAD-IB family hydrolase [Halomonas sp. ATCHA]|uniref:HAD-IB family hydrolase n=2 Tax=Halomonas llamarensis TaxID=2945104 RepID=A0ABT0SV89_9GAMM|nr:HAD-IB family hydrolase [Halomonas llamarensis]